MTIVTELHLHDHYSFLDGLNTPEEYMARAKELGMTHLAQTNHGTLSGHRAFQRAAEGAGITPILGVEAYISPTDMYDRRTKAKREDGTDVYNHIILLAQNEAGLKTMNRLSEKAWTEGFYSKPRIDRDLLFDDNEGLIVLSGCLNGLVSKAIERGDMEQAIRIAREFKANLGDRFYIEVQGHNPVEINEGLFHVADTVGIKPVTTSDCHYARKEDLWLEEAMLILSTKPKKAFDIDFSKAQKMEILDRYNYLYPDRKMTFQNIEIFLRDWQTHEDLYKASGFDRTDMLSNTMEVAERIGDYPYYKGLDILPRPEKGVDPDELLRKLAYKGLEDRGLDGKPEYVERLDHELDVIKKKNFAPYFIILEDLIRYTIREGIPRGPGRGSSAGSLLCYVLRVTEADPIEYGLIFSRFIDESRSDWPDADLDFSDKDRKKIKDYLTRKYTHAASIATFTYYKGKQAIKDAARALGVPLGDTERALKDNDAPVGANYMEFFLDSEKGSRYASRFPEVIDLANGLMGRIRGGGMHAAGIVVSSIPLSEIAPIQTGEDPNDKKGPRIAYIAYDHEEVAELGGIKLDILGLKNLRIIDECLKYIEQRHGVKMDMLKVPMDDKKTYNMLARGETQAVFQADGSTFTDWILKNQMYSFMDIVNGTAISRPGALNTVGKDYRARLRGEQQVTYQNQIIYDITKETLGCVVFQEQVMRMMTDLAGMSGADANKVRKIIGKKRDVTEFEQYKEAFVKGAQEYISEKDALKLWHDFEAHAGYSFNLSHAVVYSMVTYWTAYLKAHFPLEYMAAVLLAEENKESFTAHLIEIKRMGIPVYLPHVQYSESGPTIQNDGIRLGLSNVKYVSETLANRIIAKRPYESYGQFAEAVLTKGSGMNTRMLDSLNKVGAAEYDDNPRNGDERENYYEYLGIPAFSYDMLPGDVWSRLTKVGNYIEGDACVIMGVVTEVKHGNGWSRINFLDESGTASAFASAGTEISKGQFYAMLVGGGSVIKYIAAADITEDGGMLCRQLFGKVGLPPEGKYKVMAFTTRKTKKKENMGTAILMDDSGQMLSALVWPSQYGACFPYMTDDNVVDLELRETEDGATFVHQMRKSNGW